MKKISYNIHQNKVKHVLEKDPSLRPLFKQVKAVDVYIEEDYFQFLVFTIIGQQLSVTVADTIFKRIKSHFHDNVHADAFLNTDDDTLRELGLSYRKIAYLKALATADKVGVLNKSNIDNNDIEKISTDLLNIKGIGPWTVDMFLIFSLGHEDVFSVGDLGLRNAYKKIIGDTTLTNAEIERKSRQWKPYRTIVAHFLWKYWDELRHET